MSRYRPDMPEWFKKYVHLFKGHNPIINESMFSSMIGDISNDDEYLTEKGYNPTGKSVSWLKFTAQDGTKRSIMVNHNKEQKENFWLEFESRIVQSFAELAPKYENIIPHASKDLDSPKMAMLKLSDTHFGKRAKDHNNKIIKMLVEESSKRLLHRANNSHQIEYFVLKVGDDWLHTENGKTTTKGTPQDTDGSWLDAYITCLESHAEVIEMYATVAPVIVFHCPSNHDERMGISLGVAIQQRFLNHPNVTVVVNEEYMKPHVYGRCFFGLAHGHKAKEKSLIRKLSEDYPREWAQSTYRYIVLAHLHHYFEYENGYLTNKEHGSVTTIRPSDIVYNKKVVVHYPPSLSGSDLYHRDMAYTGQRRTLTLDIYDPLRGRINLMQEPVTELDLEGYL